MKAGVGYTNCDNAFDSGRDAVKQAMKQGGLSSPKMVLAFCSGQLNADEFIEGVHSQIDSTIPIVGGTSLGVITNHNLAYEDNSCAVACIEADDILFESIFAEDLNSDEFNAGERLAGKLSDEVKYQMMLLFYESIKKPMVDGNPPVMNATPPLLNGIASKLPYSLPIFGGGLVKDFMFSCTRQFCGHGIKEKNATAVAMRGNFEFHHKIMHGCVPKDGIYHTITAMEGQFIYEVDNRPIVEMINETYGGKGWQKQIPVQMLTIGVNHGDQFGEFDEETYVNRLITGVLPDEKGIVIFEPDLSVGMDIQFMIRDSQRMVDTAEEYSAAFLKDLIDQGKKPSLGFYVDCAGRTSDQSNTLEEEAQGVQKTFNTYNIPLLGYYSGVEVAPMLGENRSLDWTGVLLVLTEK